MKATLKIEKKEPVCCLASEITYMQKKQWCDATFVPLRLSFMKPRQYYPYDPDPFQRYPLIVFLCGGAWQKMDRNVWMPELTYFAKHGYAIASVEYSTFPFTEHPERLMEVKTAIRYLRENAEELHIIPDQIAVLGESAGAYLAALCALTGDDFRYKTSYFDTQSDAVQAAITWYAPTLISTMNNSKLRVRMDNFPDLPELVNAKTPPFLMFHGKADHQVPYQQSELLYQSLQEQGIASDLYLIENADHGDGHFFQKEIKEYVLHFLNTKFKNKLDKKEAKLWHS
ncbi:MAG: prolyl oligopeptidase family serine peptidase [Lachnospiraceae bacterium]|nr:prolyl oligopeptidase family serine peptidase [Lachnospiraceae bacterium]